MQQGYRRVGFATALGVAVVTATLGLGGRLAHGADDAAFAHIDIPARGVVKALHQAQVSAQILAPVDKIGFREGERFGAGQQLIAFDCRRQRHELDALDAQMREAHVAVEANEHLVRGGASNRSEVAVAGARFDKARAEWKAMQQLLTNCHIAAPFAGIVTELSVSAHEVPQPNRPLMTIVDDRNLEIEIIAPSRLLDVLRRTTTFSFAIDETGRTYDAKVLRTGGSVDPISQTVKFYAGFIVPPHDVLPGMSGVADINISNVAAGPDEAAR